MFDFLNYESGELDAADISGNGEFIIKINNNLMWKGNYIEFVRYWKRKNSSGN